MRRHPAWVFAAALIASLVLAGCWGSDKTLATTAPIAAPVATGNLNAQIQAVQIPADGKPVVTFGLYDENGVALEPAVLLASTGGSLRFHIARINADGFYANYCQNASGLPSFDVVIPSASQIASLGGGRFTYKFSISLDNAAQTLGGITLAGNEGLTHTVAISAARTILTPSGKSFLQAVNPYFHFRPDGGAVTATREIVAVSNCDGCHHKLNHHTSRIEIALCVMCHYAGVTDIKGTAATGNSINLRDLVHRIHSGVNLPSNKAGGKFVIGGDTFADVKFPLNSSDNWVTNTPIKCVKCHKLGTDAAGRPFGRDFARFQANPTPNKCTSCHNMMIFDNTVTSVTVKGGATGQSDIVVPDTSASVVKHYNYAGFSITNALGVNKADDPSTCLKPGQIFACHANPAIADTTEYNYGNVLSAHAIIDETSRNFFRDGTKPHFQILAVDNIDAVNRSPRVTFKIACDNGDAIAPSAIPNVTTLTIKCGYIKAGDADFSNDLMFDSPGVMTKVASPMSLAITGSAAAIGRLTDNGDGTYTASFGSVGAFLPAGASAGTGIITLEGRVGMLGSITTIRKTLNNGTTRFSSDAGQWYFNLADGAHVTAPALMRREIVDTNKCRVCHSRLKGHTFSRVNTKECVVCHNPNLSDNAGLPTYGEVPLSLKYMIMRIHTGNKDNTWFLDADTNASKLRFPGDTSYCLTCHIDTIPLSYGIPLPAGVLNQSITRGLIQNSVADDIKVGPVQAVCQPCHNTALSASMVVNYGYISTTPGSTERCAVCHTTGLLYGPDFSHEPLR